MGSVSRDSQVNFIMILRNINIQNLGSVTHFSQDFAADLNVLEEKALDEISYAIRSVLNHKIPPSPLRWLKGGTRVEANVLIDGKNYLVLAAPNEAYKGLKLRCYDDDGIDITAEYLYLTSHCYEQDLSDVFAGEEEKMLLRFLKYANEDLYYSPRELSEKTDGLSDVKAFRTYLRSFIEDFQPEPLRDEKEYEIIIEKCGRYAVRCKIDSSTPSALSESERTLFRYLCFLLTAEFWQGFEELRNLHSIKKPLLVSNFLERLDEAIDVGHLLLRTRRLKRQIIILTTKKR